MNKPQSEWIKETGLELIELLTRKDNDYGNSIGEQYRDYGLLSGLIRLDDKMKRLKTLYRKEKAEVNESIDDTLVDLAGYAVMILIERKKEKQ